MIARWLRKYLFISTETLKTFQKYVFLYVGGGIRTHERIVATGS